VDADVEKEEGGRADEDERGSGTPPQADGPTDQARVRDDDPCGPSPVRATTTNIKPVRAAAEDPVMT